MIEALRLGSAQIGLVILLLASQVAVGQAKLKPRRSFDRRQLELSQAPVTSVVAMIHVTDIESSAAFYRLRGFESATRLRVPGRAVGCGDTSPKAENWKRGPNFMLTRTARPLSPDVQDVLFY